MGMGLAFENHALVETGDLDYSVLEDSVRHSTKITSKGFSIVQRVKTVWLRVHQQPALAGLYKTLEQSQTIDYVFTNTEYHFGFKRHFKGTNPFIRLFHEKSPKPIELHSKRLLSMEPLAGFEPATLSLRMRCSTN